MFDLIVVKGRLLGQDGFQQFPQLGDIPLFIAQVIDKLSHGLFRLYLEEFIEGTADGDHPEVLIQRDQGFTHGVDDALGEFTGFICGFFDDLQFFAGLFQAGFYLLALGDVLDGQKDDPLLAHPSFNLPGIQTA